MKRIAYIDRDGTLIAEPDDFQIDAYEKIRFVPGMLDGLRALQDDGFVLVMVSNQDGLGTDAFPTEHFEGPRRLLMQLLESQGISTAFITIPGHIYMAFDMGLSEADIATLRAKEIIQ